MKRTTFLSSLLGLAGAAALALAAPGARAADALESGFRNPPDSARPHSWWHWMNGNITREGTTADLVDTRDGTVSLRLGAPLMDIEVHGSRLGPRAEAAGPKRRHS